MRTLLLTLLISTVAAPAIAAPRDSEDRRGKPKAERSEPAKRAEPRAERQARPERAQRPERPERSVASPPSSRPTLERPERRADAPRERPDQRADAPRERRPVMERLREQSRASRGTATVTPRTRPERTEVQPTGDSVRDWRSRERRRDDSPSTIEQRNLRRAPLAGRGDDQLVEPRRPLPRVLDSDRRERRISRTPRPGTEPPPPRTANADVAQPRHRWRDDWRRDRRFDWRDHRRRHRSLFRFSVYVDPFGWGYHRYGAGWRLWPSYYSSHFWLNDPWMYRLPPSYGPYRWIRYYDDALLVNIYSGQVVDVIHDFFW